MRRATFARKRFARAPRLTAHGNRTRFRIHWDEMAYTAMAMALAAAFTLYTL